MAVLAVGVLALSAIGVSGASAATPPATGSLTCNTSGNITTKPDLTNVASTKPITMTGKKLPVADCDASGVSGGKAPITDGVLDVSAKLPKGSSCVSLATDPIPPLKITLKLVNMSVVNGKAKSVTVATIKPTNVVTTLTVVDEDVSLSVSGDVPDNKTHTKAFGGEHFSVNLGITNFTEVAACIGGIPINTIGVAGPITIAPAAS
jgi:hypothetical protein